MQYITTLIRHYVNSIACLLTKNLVVELQEYTRKRNLVYVEQWLF